jgi:hypothetical protein
MELSLNFATFPERWWKQGVELSGQNLRTTVVKHHPAHGISRFDGAAASGAVQEGITIDMSGGLLFGQAPWEVWLN